MTSSWEHFDRIADEGRDPHETNLVELIFQVEDFLLDHANVVDVQDEVQLFLLDLLVQRHDHAREFAVGNHFLFIEQSHQRIV